MIRINNFNWNKLINHNSLRTSGIDAQGAQMLFTTFPQPPDTSATKKGDFPSQLLAQIGLNIYIRALDIKNCMLKYTQITRKNSQPVIVELDNMHCTLNNITNIDSMVAANRHCLIKISAKYMNASPVTATLDMILGDKKGAFRLDGMMTSLDAGELTAASKDVQIAEVSSFTMQQMNLHFEANEDYGKGSMTIRYNNLSISLNKADTNEKKKGIIPFVADQLVVYDANPMPGKEVRSVTNYYKRNPHKGFFNHIWENVIDGIEKTALRKNLITAIANPKEDPDKKGQKKKGLIGRLFHRK